MPYQAFSVHIDDRVAVVEIRSPGKGNAMGPDFWAELPLVFNELDSDDAVRAIVLTGSGPHFSYGLDVPAMSWTWSPMLAPGALAGPRARFHQVLREMQQAISAVADCRTPIVASVHGWCIGGGVDLISAVDIRYASADTRFSIREIKLAIVADLGSLARLPTLISDGHLRELALTGKDFDADHALRIGLVNAVHPDAASALAAARHTAAEIAANPPLAVRGIKEVLGEQRASAVSANLRYVAAWNSAFLPSRDLTEGIDAAFAKRPAQFTGE